MHYKTVIFDFDGVLTESNAIKDKAFEILFAQYPDKLKEIMAYQKANAFIRFIKFRHIVEVILGEEYTLERQEYLTKAFSEYTIREVTRCPWVNGALELLEALRAVCPIYMVSINPEGDLLTILENKNVRHYFKGVLTSTTLKTQEIQTILDQESLKPQEAVFIGDAQSDWVSAKQAGVDFIGRQSDKILTINDGSPVFEDLHQIKNYLF